MLNTKKILFSGIFLFLFLQFNSLFGQNIPPAPTGLRVTATECGKISLAWDGYSYNGNDELGFEIYRSEQVDNLNYVKIGETGPNFTNFDDLGYLDFDRITSSKNYLYFIIAKFTTNFSEKSLTTVGQFSCVSPAGLQVSATSCGKIVLNWNDFGPDLNESFFAIYKAENENSFYKLLTYVQGNVLTFTDSLNLIGNKPYFYKIKGKFNGVLTEFSNVASGMMECNIPQNPRIISQNCESVLLEWDLLPLGTNPKVFAIYRSEHPNGNYELFTNTQLGPTQATVYLPNTAKKYSYKIRTGFNYNNYSGFSNFATQNINCEIPTGLSVSENSCGKITLNWQDLPIIQENGYIILKSFVAESGENIRIVVGEVGPNILTFTDFGIYPFNQNPIFTIYPNGYGMSEELIPNKNYTYSIVAKFGNSFSSPTTPILAKYSCDNVINIVSTNTNCNNISINWTRLNQSLGITSYDIYKTELDDTRYISVSDFINTTILNGDFGKYQITGRVGGLVTNFQMPTTKLKAGKIYHFIIVAKKNTSIVGISNSTPVSFSCYDPPLLTLVSSSCEKISLSWNDFPEGVNETGYYIYRSETSNESDFKILTNVAANVLSYEDIGNYGMLQSGKTYYYKIAGIFNSKTAEFSNSVFVNFNCIQGPQINLVEASCGKVLIAWNPLPNLLNNFYVYRSSTGLNGAYKLVGLSSNNQFADFGDSTEPLDANKIYYYKIAQFVSYFRILTDFSNSIASSPNCLGPINLKVNSFDCDLINLIWESHPFQGKNGSGYDIYRSTDGANGIFQKIGTSISNEYKDYSSINFGLNYFYKIKFTSINDIYDYPFVNYISDLSSPINVQYKVSTSQNGQWHTPSTWSCGHVPSSLDDILINNGHTITIGENLIGNCKNIENNGNLVFGVGSEIKLNMP